MEDVPDEVPAEEANSQAGSQEEASADGSQEEASADESQEEADSEVEIPESESESSEEEDLAAKHAAAEAAAAAKEQEDADHDLSVRLAAALDAALASDELTAAVAETAEMNLDELVAAVAAVTADEVKTEEAEVAKSAGNDEAPDQEAATVPPDEEATKDAVIDDDELAARFGDILSDALASGELAAAVKTLLSEKDAVLVKQILTTATANPDDCVLAARLATAFDIGMVSGNLIKAVNRVVEGEPEEDPNKPPPLPPMEAVVWLELKKGELVCNPEAMDVFVDETGFVNPVMVSGKLRTGKSYLMNALSDSQAFGVSSQARSFTQGVHICNRLAPLTVFGGPIDGPKLAFVDAEGQADKGKSYDIKLATPLLLVSKVIIMNEICPTGPSKEDILRTIEIFMRAAEQVSERKKRKKLFGNLHLMMRDCAQPEQECWDIIFEQEDPNESETDEQAKAIEERNKIREGIFVAFETTPKVWCLPKLMQSKAPSNYRDCAPAYVNKINEIRAYMCEQLKEPKLLDDKPLTGTMIAALMPQLQEALKSDSPILNPPSMMQAVCDLEAERIAQKMADEAERYFRIDLARRLPLASPHYEGELDCAKALLAQDFREQLDHLPKESQEKVFPPFEQRLMLMDERLAALNREKLAEKATQEALDRANQLEQQMELERKRADDARSEIDNLLAAREQEKNRADMLLAQIEESNRERQAERDRIAELEELLNKEVGEREADLQKQVEEEKKKVLEAEELRKEEESKMKEEQAEQERLLEEQRAEMEEMQRQMDEERKAREQAEKELGLREEEIAKEDEAAQQMERAAEAKKEIPLILAVKECDVYAVRGLVRRHPDSLHMKDKNQRTALHFADDKEVVHALLKGKGDPNDQDMGFWTPLHVAASKGAFVVAEALMNASANVLLTTRHGNTALDLAYDKPDMTVMLLSQLPELYNTLEADTRARDAAARHHDDDPPENENDDEEPDGADADDAAHADDGADDLPPAAGGAGEGEADAVADDQGDDESDDASEEDEETDDEEDDEP